MRGALLLGFAQGAVDAIEPALDGGDGILVSVGEGWWGRRRRARQGRLRRAPGLAAPSGAFASSSGFGIRRPPVPDRRLDRLRLLPHVVDGFAGDDEQVRRQLDGCEFKRLGKVGWAAPAGGFCACCVLWKGNWKQPVSKNGSSHAAHLAGDFILPTPSRFKRLPVADAGVPAPRR